MAYTIYRHVTLRGIETEKVTRNLRTSDITQDTFRRDSHSIRVAEFSNYKSGSIAQVEQYIGMNQNLSVAINEHHQVIAVVNHTTGKHGKVFESKSANMKDYISAALFMIPIAAFGCWLIYRSLPYFEVGDDRGYIPGGFGVAALALAFFIFRGYTKEVKESGKALKELLNQ